jgi:hypothetical protein
MPLPESLLHVLFVAGGFLTITKLWANDTLTLHFPITLRTEAIKGMDSQINIISLHFPSVSTLNYRLNSELFLFR